MRAGFIGGAFVLVVWLLTGDVEYASFAAYFSVVVWAMSGH